MNDRQAGYASDGGFTLLELLVSLTLLALMAAVVPSLVRMAGRSAQFAADLTRSQSEIPAIEALADHLSKARPLKTVQDDGQKRVLFSGTESSISFVAPGIVGRNGGLVSYELGLITNRAGRRVLALSRAILDGEAKVDPAASSDVRVPMPAVQQVAFRYFGPQDSGSDPSWSDRWDAQELLPQLVEMRTVTVRRGASRSHTVIVALEHYEPPSPTKPR